MQGQGFRDRTPELTAANAVILGASFDSVNDQRRFAEAQAFPYQLLSDPDRSAGAAYDVVRQPGEQYAEAGLPRRISYLIDPEGRIVKAYDLAGQDLAAHAAEVLEEINARS